MLFALLFAFFLLAYALSEDVQNWVGIGGNQPADGLGPVPAAVDPIPRVPNPGAGGPLGPTPSSSEDGDYIYIPLFEDFDSIIYIPLSFN